MESFRPFRATAQRHQKYYSQKKQNRILKGSIFNLPREIIEKRTSSLINPQNVTKSRNQLQKTQFVTDYQSNLKITAKKHSTQILDRKHLQKVVNTFIENDKMPQYKLIRNKSSELYTNKSMAFKTLNILYRTIIQTKVRRKPRQKFELSPKKLPILQKIKQKNNSGYLTRKSGSQLQKNSSFDKYKLNLTTINDQNIGSSTKYSKFELGSIKRDEQEQHFLNRSKRRFDHYTSRDGLVRKQNEIVPWNQIAEVQQEWYY